MHFDTNNVSLFFLFVLPSQNIILRKFLYWVQTEGFRFSLFSFYILFLNSGWTQRDESSQRLFKFEFHYLLFTVSSVSQSALIFVHTVWKECNPVVRFCFQCYIWTLMLLSLSPSFVVIAKLQCVSLSCIFVVPYLFNLLLSSCQQCASCTKKEKLSGRCKPTYSRSGSNLF